MQSKEKLLKLVLSLSNASKNIHPQNSKKIVKLGLRKEKGWLYYVDEDGDISRTKAARGRKAKPKKALKNKETIKSIKTPKKIVKKTTNKKSNLNSKLKKELLEKIKTLEKRHKLIKNKSKEHDMLKDKIIELKNKLKEIK